MPLQAWSVADVCDWLEFNDMGQYRKRFVHHQVNGPLLVKLTSQQLKVQFSRYWNKQGIMDRHAMMLGS
jgi:SAM domain (Sterile alpha motif)